MKRMALHRRRRHSRRNYRRRRYHGRGRLTVLIRFLSFLLICSAIAGALILFFRVQAFVVSGNRRYTEQEIIDSTGVEIGDNMYLLNKYAISREITTRLPYVETVSIRRSLPDTLVISVTECQAAAAVVQDGTGWLLSDGGKILEQVTVGEARQHPQITGMELLMPEVGGTMEFPAAGNATEEQILGLLASLEGRGMLEELEGIDCSDSDEMVMEYAGRFQVVMHYDDDFAQDLYLLEHVVESLQPNETGTILLTNLEDIRFVPDA